MIEDRLRSQASWHPSPAVARVSGPPFPLLLMQSLVQGQARLDGYGSRARCPSQIHHITSHRIASHSLPGWLAHPLIR